MRFTPFQIRRLRKLLEFHRNPPTWRRLLPRIAALVAAWLIIILAFGVVADGWGSPVMYYCFGLVTFLPILAIVNMYDLARRWPAIDAVVDWSRVEAAVRSADEP